MFDKKKVEKGVSEWMRPFFLIWTGQAVSLLGSSVVQFALIWWLTQRTGSATVLATATVMGFLPEIVLGPFAGALVDRWNRRRVMMLSDGLVAVATLGLAVLFWVDMAAIWQVYLILFIRSLGGVFHWAAMQASISLMAPEEHLSRVAGINQSMRGTVNVAGPPLGALLMGVLPLFGVISVDVITAAVAVLTLCFVDIPNPETVSAEEGVTAAGLWQDVREGFRYVLAWPSLVGIIIMAVLINFLFTPAATLMPLLVTEYFQGGAWELSGLESAWGIGLVAGGLALGAWGGFRKKITTSLMGIIGMGIGITLVGAAPAAAYSLAVGGMFFAGFMNPMANGPFFAVLQSRVAPEMQGRVFTLVGSLVSLMVPLSMVIAGPLADLFGVRLWFWVGGLGCLLIGVGGFFVPVIANSDSAPAPGQKQVLHSKGEPAFE